MRITVKAICLQALRNRARLADCRVADETNTTHNGVVAIEWFPILPGSLTGELIGQRIQDDGNGRIVNEAGRMIASLNYLTGTLRLMVPGDGPCVFNYLFDANTMARTPAPVDMQLVRTTEVRVRARAKGYRRDYVVPR